MTKQQYVYLRKLLFDDLKRYNESLIICNNRLKFPEIITEKKKIELENISRLTIRKMGLCNRTIVSLEKYKP